MSIVCTFFVNILYSFILNFIIRNRTIRWAKILQQVSLCFAGAEYEIFLSFRINLCLSTGIVHLKGKVLNASGQSVRSFFKPLLVIFHPIKATIHGVILYDTAL